MSDHEQLGCEGSYHGHHYQQVQVGQGARAVLGNTYNIGREDLVNLLPFSKDAPFNAYYRQHEPACLHDTRVDLLQHVYTWADGQDAWCIFWLNGLAGTGKSTIARTVARRYFDQERLGASFFFSRGGGDTSHVGKFFTSIAVQLAINIPLLRQHIENAIAKRRDIASLSLFDQWRQLVLEPLSRLSHNAWPSSFVLIVDALDECDDAADIRIILQLLSEARSLGTRLRIFLTSRPEIPIRHGMYSMPQAEHQDFVLQNIPSEIIDHDISRFLEHHLKITGQEYSLGAGWPDQRIVRQLVLTAGGLFIWAATAWRFIHNGREFAERRLSLILHSDISPNAPERQLNEIYTTVLSNYIRHGDESVERLERLSRFRKVVGSIIILSSPLSVHAVSRLLNIALQETVWTLNDLHSILDVPGNRSNPVRLHHPSFRDFLLNQQRCYDRSFWVDERQAHRILTHSCVQLMARSLRQDACRQQVPGALVADVERSQIEQSLSPEIRYACLHWAWHLQRSDAQLHDNDQVHRFLQAHLLHWLEALAWIGAISEGILAILSLETLIPKLESPGLYSLVHDAWRFALHNRSIIEQAPLQIYCSALAFSPKKSSVRAHFERDIPSWIRMRTTVQADCDAMLQILEGHTDSVFSVAFSPDSKYIVSGSFDHTVRLWDARTGATVQKLEGHSDLVNAVAFSPNGKHIASGSNDHTLRLWDASTGDTVQILEVHSGTVDSVAFSPDGRHIVAVLNPDQDADEYANEYTDEYNDDYIVQLWDASTGATVQILKGHSDLVNAVAFSPDGKHIASGSHDHTVRLWDASTGDTVQILEGHSGTVDAMAFSPDGKHIVSVSNNDKFADEYTIEDTCTVQVWDASTRATVQIREGHSDWVSSVAFSPDSKHIALGSYDHTVLLWDASALATVQILEGHSGVVSSVAFSPDGKHIVSGGPDKTVRLWDAITKDTVQQPKGYSGKAFSVAYFPDGKHVLSGPYTDDSTVRMDKGCSDAVTSVAFSPDGKHFVSGSRDSVVRLWDAATGAIVQMLQCHSNIVTSVAFSPDGKHIVSGSYDSTVRLWYASTGIMVQTLRSSVAGVVCFSPNGKYIVSSKDCIVEIWEASTGTALEGNLHAFPIAFSSDGKHIVSGSWKHTMRLSAIAFSSDGKSIVSGLFNNTMRLWDASTRAIVQNFKGHSDRVSSVDFSLNGKHIVSGSWDHTVRVWDASTGATVQMLKDHSKRITSVAFSPDRKHIVSSDDNMVRIWEASTGIVVRKLKGYLYGITSIAFSPDGKYIFFKVGDRIWRVWDASTSAAVQKLQRSCDWVSSVASSEDSSIAYTIVMSATLFGEGFSGLFWLPPAYRPTCYASCNQNIVLGHVSGEITIVEFKEGPKIIGAA